MSGPFRALILALLGVILAAGCSPSGSTAAPVHPADTPFQPTATSAPPVGPASR